MVQTIRKLITFTEFVAWKPDGSYYELYNESLWDKCSTVQTNTSIPLVVEIVSSNWRDDYLTKVRDYEKIASGEYSNALESLFLENE
jgi:Uma2 family endonuclease